MNTAARVRRQTRAAVAAVNYWCWTCEDERDADQPTQGAVQTAQRAARKHADLTGHDVHVSVTRIQIFQPRKALLVVPSITAQVTTQTHRNAVQ